MATLTKSQQHQVEELLADAMALDADKREACLGAADVEPEVRAEVESLMAFDLDSSRKLETPIVSPNAIAQTVDALDSTEDLSWNDDPDAIENYTIIRRIGEGGMGRVLLAQQEKPLRRQVAIKLIKLGMDTRSVIARFETERQALALMNHPNVARAIDAGADSNGRPYFVMEYVDGTHLTKYCDQEALKLQDRLELFRTVCAAIQHAHQKGVIHRDIKPSNVLVTEDDGTPMVKVIDFGVAKATRPGQQGHTVHTQRGTVIGTPAYMSPEQTRSNGEDIDTRTDVYSLGVLLYELLVGALPFDDSLTPIGGAGAGEQPARIAKPIRPTSRLDRLGAEAEQHARRCGTTATYLRKQLRGDLEWIAMKCLEEDRDRRYATPSEISEDIARFLRDEPVEAGPPGVAYRAKKFALRNRALVASLAAVFVVLVGGVVTTTLMYFEAQRARDLAETEKATAEEIGYFVQQMLTSIDPRVARGQDVSLLREVLDTAAERIETEDIQNVAVAASLHRTIGSAYHSIAEHEEAEKHLGRSLKLCERQLPPEPLALAAAQSGLGNLLRQLSRFDEARPLLERALATRVEQLGTNHETVALAHYNLAILQEQTGSNEAEGSYQEALAIYQSQPGASAAEARTRHAYGIYLRNRHRLDEAGEQLRAALRLQQEIFGKDHPHVIPMKLGLGLWHRQRKEYDQALSHMTDALTVARQNYPKDHPELLIVLSNLAALYQDLNKYEAAEAIYRETLQIQRDVLGASHIDVGTATNNLATLLLKMGRFAEAEPLFRQAVEIYRTALGKDHYWVSIVLSSIARVREQLGDCTEVDALTRECLRIRRLLTDPPDWCVAEIETLRAGCMIQQGRLDAAEQLLRRCLPPLEQHYGLEARLVKETRGRLAALEEMEAGTRRPSGAAESQGRGGPHSHAPDGS